MIMALVSLTWEIKGQPDCAKKQVSSYACEYRFFFLLLDRVVTIIHVSTMHVERCTTFLTVGYDARSCNAFAK